MWVKLPLILFLFGHEKRSKVNFQKKIYSPPTRIEGGGEPTGASLIIFYFQSLILASEIGSGTSTTGGIAPSVALGECNSRRSSMPTAIECNSRPSSMPTAFECNPKGAKHPKGSQAAARSAKKKTVPIVPWDAVRPENLFASTGPRNAARPKTNSRLHCPRSAARPPCNAKHRNLPQSKSFLTSAPQANSYFWTSAPQAQKFFEQARRRSRIFWTSALQAKKILGVAKLRREASKRTPSSQKKFYAP